MSTSQIESYRFGRIIIDGQTHSKDVIILPDRVIENWWRQEGHALHLDDLAISQSRRALYAEKQTRFGNRGYKTGIAGPPGRPSRRTTACARGAPSPPRSI
ncbi:MAG: hypothetical protein B6I35_13630 [Anaerolineaceae bacterium 4572_32.2]|nr:MAG: hypothetical protein B6I35_13630 [Anaerolineaceae bacterium 4572_32.2]